MTAPGPGLTDTSRFEWVFRFFCGVLDRKGECDFLRVRGGGGLYRREGVFANFDRIFKALPCETLGTRMHPRVVYSCLKVIVIALVALNEYVEIIDV